MKKKNLLFAGLLGLLVIPFGVNAEEITVCQSDCTYTSLSDAVTNASANDTIKLNESTIVSSKILVDKALTIDLNGNSIDASGISDTDRYVFEFNAKDTEFTLTDTSATAGSITSNQRGILVTSGTLTYDKISLTSSDRAIQINPVTDGGKAEVIIEGGVVKTTGTNATRTIMLWGNNVAGEASLIVNGGTISAPIGSDNSAAINLGSNDAAGNTVTVNGGNISGYNGIRLYGNGTKGMTVLTMNGGKVTAVNAGIIQSTTDGTENTEIYLYGGSITAEDQEGQAEVGGDAVAIHHSQTGVLVIGKEDGTGPTLVGETTIAIKEGDITINGGTITATGEYRDVAEARNDGTEDTGAAVSITSNPEYADGVNLTINGGTIESINGNALYEGIPVTEGTPVTTTSNLKSLKISDGEFISAEDKDSVAVTSYEETGFITGGTYSSDVTEYLSSDLKVTTDENGNYVVAEETTTTPTTTEEVKPAQTGDINLIVTILTILTTITGVVIMNKKLATRN